MATNKIIPTFWIQAKGGEMTNISNYYGKILESNFVADFQSLWAKHQEGKLKCAK
jgi:hypothetical protein